MSLSDLTARDEVWSELQQPTYLSGTEPRLRLLLSALDQGWRIEDPAYLRPRWGEHGGRVYHFILHRPYHASRLITVPETDEVTRFVKNESLRVVAKTV
jgi:hypothetical protein